MYFGSTMVANPYHDAVAGRLRDSMGIFLILVEILNALITTTENGMATTIEGVLPFVSDEESASIRTRVAQSRNEANRLRNQLADITRFLIVNFDTEVNNGNEGHEELSDRASTDDDSMGSAANSRTNVANNVTYSENEDAAGANSRSSDPMNGPEEGNSKSGGEEERSDDEGRPNNDDQTRGQGTRDGSGGEGAGSKKRDRDESGSTKDEKPSKSSRIHG